MVPEPEFTMVPPFTLVIVPLMLIVPLVVMVPLFTIEPPALIVSVSFVPTLSVCPDGTVNVCPFEIVTVGFNSSTFGSVPTVLTTDSETAVGVGAVNPKSSISFGSEGPEDTGFAIKSVTI